MKKVFLLAAIGLTSFTSAIAQPILSAASNNPVAGDVFYGHVSDTTGVTPGASGATVTWNFATLPTVYMDTVNFVSCTVAPDCGTFSGSNLAIMSSTTDFSYFNEGPAGLTMLGYVSGGMSSPYVSGLDVFYYPLSYNSTHTDTAIMDYAGFDIQHISDSFVYDAYGTLILPTGTFTNAVRVHKISITRDSSFAIPTWDVSVSRTDDYFWYVSGIHFPLLQLTIDTAYGNSVEYYGTSPSLGTATIDEQAGGMRIFPNPAAQDIHIAFNIAETKNAVVSVADLTGSVVATVSSERMVAGANDITIPVSNLPAGMYIVQLKSPEGVVAKKVVVSH